MTRSAPVERPSLTRTWSPRLGTYLATDAHAYTTIGCSGIVQWQRRYTEFGGGDNPNNAPICGTEYSVSAPNGNSIVVTIQDKCQACEEGHIDLTPAAFEALGYNRDQGVIDPLSYGPR